ncbi:hypothetical protein [Staphylococcus haemolyticus]|uniref:hypothetical protein n=1 Tax=Staphylococcus haemolyticus TaxID=1283 RepID=UPI001F0A7459|nr:hypothetical protein [Staphylococcus haemolyticus]MCH4331173.1 hypothetical protein [Staphylococcus haemolyticus]MCH4338238.1 hypothetical protein [Staphylococcus haemolyticus]MCH4342840.1 hypothetical protein [Staphylococcus haemolyticus]MCH4345180.1 hypothetical protein [Staphylococcus haemolyticus]MCH4395816.1 hypothetical protein [Staphylococcus haemolyticus]
MDSLEQIKRKVIKFIEDKEETYIYELEPLFDKAGVPFNGKRSLVYEDKRNQVFFYHCSTESGSVISELSNENKIVIKHKPSAVNRYLLDGKVPPLPLAITDDVDKPSWVPVVLRIKGKGAN